MKSKLISLIIVSFFLNLMFFPLLEVRDIDSCVAAGTQMSGKTDVFFTGYVTFMMNLALDMVSDGKTMPAPVKTSKNKAAPQQSKSNASGVSITDSSLSDRITNIEPVAAPLAYIPAFLINAGPDIARDTSSGFGMLIFLAFIMLIYSLPRGAIDHNNMTIRKYRFVKIPARKS